MSTDPILRRAAEAVYAYCEDGAFQGDVDGIAEILSACPELAEAVAKAGAMDALEALAKAVPNAAWLVVIRPDADATYWTLMNGDTHEYLGEGPTIASAVAAAAGRGVESDQPKEE